MGPVVCRSCCVYISMSDPCFFALTNCQTVGSRIISNVTGALVIQASAHVAVQNLLFTSAATVPRSGSAIAVIDSFWVSIESCRFEYVYEVGSVGNKRAV